MTSLSLAFLWPIVPLWQGWSLKFITINLYSHAEWLGTLPRASLRLFSERLETHTEYRWDDTILWAMDPRLKNSVERGEYSFLSAFWFQILAHFCHQGFPTMRDCSLRHCVAFPRVKVTLFLISVTTCRDNLRKQCLFQFTVWGYCNCDRNMRNMVLMYP